MKCRVSVIRQVFDDWHGLWIEDGDEGSIARISTNLSGWLFEDLGSWCIWTSQSITRHKPVYLHFSNTPKLLSESGHCVSIMIFSKLVRYDDGGKAVYGDLIANSGEGFLVQRLDGSIEHGFSTSTAQPVLVETVRQSQLSSLRRWIC